MTGAVDESSRWPLAEGAVLLAVALACTAFQLWLPSTHVEESEYQQVAQVLAQEAKPGDVVLLYPWWTERARIYVPDGLPVVGFQGSDGEALEQHPRIWLLAEPGLPRSDVGELMKVFGPQRTEVGSERRFGHLSLRLFTNGRYRPLSFSASELLPRAQVYLEQPDGTRTACTWNGSGHACPGGKLVAVEWHEVHFQPRRCLRFDAPGGPTKLVVELPPVPASDTVVMFSGYTWEHGSFKEGVTPSDLGLEVNGIVSPLTLPTGLETLQRLERQGVPEGARVRAFIQSANPAARETCLEIYGYGPGSAR